jgi:hypothetical protein
VFIRLREKLNPLFVDRVARRLLLASAVFNLAAWALLLVRLFPFLRRGAIIGLHYNVYLNVNAVGWAWLGLLPPAIGTIILVVNAALAARSYGPNRTNALIFLTVTAFYEVLLAAASVFVTLINMPR